MKRLLYISILISLTFCGCSNDKQLVNDYTNLDSNTYENINAITENSDDIKINELYSIENVETTLSQNQIIHNEEIENTLPKEITISFVGDCTLGIYKGQGTSGNYNEYYDNYGGDYFLENVRHIFESDDITFINLEGPITDRSTTANKEFPINCRPEHINIINNSSIEVCSLANNHTLDCGQNGLIDTQNILNENNIGYCGNGSIYRTVVEDINISCLAYNGWSASEDLLTQITNDITNERENGANIICVMFHWGEERNNYSNSIQQQLAYHTIDSGADIVVGSHPHVIQGIEKYNGKTIIYSLGNFTFGANKNPSDKDTFIFQQTFVVDEDSTEYGNYNIIPCSISSENNRNNYQPTPLQDENAEKILDRIKEYSSIYNSTIFNH